MDIGKGGNIPTPAWFLRRTALRRHPHDNVDRAYLRRGPWGGHKFFRIYCKAFLHHALHLPRGFGLFLAGGVYFVGTFSPLPPREEAWVAEGVWGRKGDGLRVKDERSLEVKVAQNVRRAAQLEGEGAAAGRRTK